MSTKTLKTANLLGPALDWAVAKCEGFSTRPSLDGTAVIIMDLKRDYSPSTRWSEGGPIIERELIDLLCEVDPMVLPSPAESWMAASNTACGFGRSPLIAAMRCLCVAKLGDTIDIPEELIAP